MRSHQFGIKKGGVSTRHPLILNARRKCVFWLDGLLLVGFVLDGLPLDGGLVFLLEELAAELVHFGHHGVDDGHLDKAPLVENEQHRKGNDERDALIAKTDLLEDTTLSTLLTRRYVDEAKWDEIMAEMCFSETHVYRLHRKAIAVFDQKLKEGS